MSFSYYVVEVAGEAVDRQRKAEAVALAKKAVRGLQTHWNPNVRRVDAAVVRRETDTRSALVFGIWRDANGEICESKDPETIRGISLVNRVRALEDAED